MRNRAEATFSYLISIHTGVRQNAGTTSSVYIVISGDEWESTPMPLVDHDRKVFQRGQENNFVITLPRPLGNLTHIRIWHDNYGTILCCSAPTKILSHRMLNFLSRNEPIKRSPFNKRPFRYV